LAHFARWLFEEKFRSDFEVRQPASTMSSVSGRPGPKRTEYLRAYRFMLLARVLEEKLASLYRGGLIKGGVFLGRGQEALSVSVGVNLRKGDIFAPLIRDQAGRMAFGIRCSTRFGLILAHSSARCAVAMVTFIVDAHARATTR
jgi:TPP-dependent pyruvate/acetoin dehydrogenase alpha subunit